MAADVRLLAARRTDELLKELARTTPPEQRSVNGRAGNSSNPGHCTAVRCEYSRF